MSRWKFFITTCFVLTITSIPHHLDASCWELSQNFLQSGVRKVRGILVGHKGHEAIYNYLKWRPWIWRNVYTGAKLVEKRSSVILENLNSHGFKDVSNFKSGRKALEALSKLNLKRLFPDEVIRLDLFDREIKEVVKGISLHFIHAGMLKGELKVPVLSAAVLARLGFDFGIIHTQQFNRLSLKSSENVFFDVVYTYQSKAEGVEVKSKWGPHNLFIINRVTAEKIGYMSTYVMNPIDLYNYSSKALSHTINISSSHDIQNTIKKLHLNDFTVADFEKIVQYQLGKSLTQMKRDNYPQYTSVLEQIQKASSYSQVAEILEQHVFNRLPTMAGRFEYKVPVACEPHEVKYYKR